MNECIWHQLSAQEVITSGPLKMMPRVTPHHRLLGARPGYSMQHEHPCRISLGALWRVSTLRLGNTCTLCCHGHVLDNSRGSQQQFKVILFTVSPPSASHSAPGAQPRMMLVDSEPSRSTESWRRQLDIMSLRKQPRAKIVLARNIMTLVVLSRSFRDLCLCLPASWRVTPCGRQSSFLKM